jgi:hypothetical protein
MARSATSVKLFTLAEAWATLPLVGVIARDVCCLAREVRERRQRLEMLHVGDEPDELPPAGSDPYRDELRQVAEEVEKDERRLEGFVAELRELGVEVQEPLRGRVAFPAWVEGELGYYCWELGDPETMQWQGRDGRRVPVRPVCQKENAL